MVEEMHQHGKASVVEEVRRVITPTKAPSPGTLLLTQRRCSLPEHERWPVDTESAGWRLAEGVCLGGGQGGHCHYHSGLCLKYVSQGR